MSTQSGQAIFPFTAPGPLDGIDYIPRTDPLPSAGVYISGQDEWTSVGSTLASAPLRKTIDVVMDGHALWYTRGPNGPYILRDLDMLAVLAAAHDLGRKPAAGEAWAAGVKYLGWRAGSTGWVGFRDFVTGSLTNVGAIFAFVAAGTALGGSSVAGGTSTSVTVPAAVPAGTATVSANTVAAAAAAPAVAAPAASSIVVAGINTGVSTGVVGLNTLTSGVINSAIAGAVQSAAAGGSATQGAQAGAKAGAVNTAGTAAQQIVTQVTPLLPSGGSLSGFSNPLAGMSNPLAGLNLNLGNTNLTNPLAGASVNLGSLTPKNVALGPSVSPGAAVVPAGVAEVTPLTAPSAGVSPMIFLTLAGLVGAAMM